MGGRGGEGGGGIIIVCAGFDAHKRVKKGWTVWCTKEEGAGVRMAGGQGGGWGGRAEGQKGKWARRSRLQHECQPTHSTLMACTRTEGGVAFFGFSPI